MDAIAYKILDPEEFAALRSGSFAGAPIDVADGYIHLSTAAQLDATLAKHFKDRTGLIIAAVDLTQFGEKIRWEVARDGALFPHLYGRLESSAMIGACPAERGPDGKIKLPKADGAG